jgi:hypothetical protein
MHSSRTTIIIPPQAGLLHQLDLLKTLTKLCTKSKCQEDRSAHNFCSSSEKLYWPIDITIYDCSSKEVTSIKEALDRAMYVKNIQIQLNNAHISNRFHISIIKIFKI